MKNILILIICTLFGFQNSTYAQTIKGQFNNFSKQTLYLKGFKNFDTYSIDTVTTDKSGKFVLEFSSEDYGMGFIQSEDSPPFIVVLQDEIIRINGSTPNNKDSIDVTRSKQNKAFRNFNLQQPRIEQTLSAWGFLKSIYSTNYSSDSLFSNQKNLRKLISTEIHRLQAQQNEYIHLLPKDSYIRWFLPLRQLISNVPRVAQYQPQNISKTRNALQHINYSDDRLYKSGLLKEAIEHHIWFIENSSGSLNQVFQDLNTSIDIMIDQLKNEPYKFNLILSKVFDVLEERSLVNSSEYLSQRLLNDKVCDGLSPTLEKKLNLYEEMATGATAPDIVFSQHTYFPDDVSAKTLSEVQADYYVVTFAAGWCSHCQEAMPKLADLYPRLKDKSIEVILVSLDENTKEFTLFAAPLPFISTTDYNKWESQAVKDYHIYATPTYFILNDELKILKRMKSVAHIEAWVNYNIKS